MPKSNARSVLFTETPLERTIVIPVAYIIKIQKHLYIMKIQKTPLSYSVVYGSWLHGTMRARVSANRGTSSSASADLSGPSRTPSFAAPPPCQCASSAPAPVRSTPVVLRSSGDCPSHWSPRVLRKLVIEVTSASLVLAIIARRIISMKSMLVSGWSTDSLSTIDPLWSSMYRAASSE